MITSEVPNVDDLKRMKELLQYCELPAFLVMGDSSFSSFRPMKPDPPRSDALDCMAYSMYGLYGIPVVTVPRHLLVGMCDDTPPIRQSAPAVIVERPAWPVFVVAAVLAAVVWFFLSV